MRTRVIVIVDGDTFDVNPGWQWNGEQGNRVRPTGFDAPEVGTLAGAFATRRVQDLLLGKYVDLRKAYRIDRGRLVCDVYFEDKYLADYLSQTVALG